MSLAARLARALARVTAPLTRPLAGWRFFPLWAVVHHTGRSSGRPYATPVAVRATPESFVIALPWGSATQWVRNVLSAGGCQLRWRGELQPASRPEVVDFAAASEAFSGAQRWILRVAGVRTFLRLAR